jgi:glycosyltransferase involved in cell wall biosynthesis
MHEDAPRVSVIITAHAERPHWLRRAIRSVLTQQDAPDFELLIVCDKATQETEAAAFEFHDVPNVRNFSVSYGDLGEARNHCVKIGPEEGARGKYVAFLDGDDLFGARWLRQAYDYARAMPVEGFVLHPEFNVFFGAQQFMHRHIGDDSPEHDAKDLLQFNAWSALAFAPRSVFERHPYERARDGFGYEDFQFNASTVGAGITHRCVPGSAHMIRMKDASESMAARYVRTNLAIPRQELFDRRDLPDAAPIDQTSRPLPPEVFQQVIHAHREIGERQLMLNPQMTIRRYPRQRTWNDQAWIRDQIGDAKHVVLVDNLVRGGAEKYAIDFAAAVGAVIIETSPSETGIWRERAKAAGVKVVSWTPQTKGISEEEACMAFQRAAIQAELRSLFVCNSRIGWALVHQNAQILAKRVLAASFAPVPQGNGIELCPPYFLKTIAPNLVIVTDNKAHAELVRDYNGAPVIVLPPKCDYTGPSKRKQIDTKRLRVLWAGRGTPEKNPGVLPAVAAILEDKADIHVWGDVRPLNGPENLKYRGPFDNFEAIDGTYDVYLMTSITEGCPNTAMEAVLAGIPVVAPEIGALPLLATMHYRGDPTAIAQAITHSPQAYTAAPKLLVQKWRDEFDGTARLIVGYRMSDGPSRDDFAPSVDAPIAASVP